MHIRKHIFILFALPWLTQKGFSQVDSVYTGVPTKDHSKKTGSSRINPDWWKEKISYGGFINPNYSVSSYGSLFSLSANPNIGYRLTKEMTLGVGATYYYTSLTTKLGKYTQSIYGPNAFCRYKILTNAFFQVEYDKLNQPDFFNGSDKRVWVDYFYVGGGYCQRITANSGFLISFMYNLTPSNNSVFFNRMLNFGFVSGF
jgi:hypothetical protein